MSDFFNGYTVLVTGGAGFIGSHLVESLLGHGVEVVIVIHSLNNDYLHNLEAVRSRATFEELDLVNTDLRPLFRETEFNTVFHLAGNAHVTQSVEHPEMDLEKNIIGTFRLLEAIRDVSPASRIIFTSSATVFGESVRSPIREDDPKIPESPYGVSKLTCEHYMRLFAKLYGLRTATARLFSVYGPRLRKQVVYDLMCRLQENPDELFIHGDGTQVRDMNYVSNVTDALLLIAQEARLEGEDYNVATGKPVTIREIAEQVCEAMNLNPRFKFSGEVRPGETQKLYPDINKLFSLGYTANVSLSSGLKNTAAWFSLEA